MALAEIMNGLFTNFANIGKHSNFYSAAFYYKTVGVGCIVQFFESCYAQRTYANRLAWKMMNKFFRQTKTATAIMWVTRMKLYW